MNMLPLHNCLCCNSTQLTLILDLGQQPLANNLKSSIAEKVELYPLALNVCTECFHAQLSHAVDPKLMFQNYLYVSGTTNTLKEYFKWFANYVIHDCYPKTVLDIGCNDGTQLNYFKEHNIKTYGIDPAQNLVDVARSAGHDIENAFVDENYNTNNQQYDCIIAQNVFAHNSNPYQFLMKCYEMLSDDGTLYIQTSQADMFINNEFDTVYHEHISFFNINSMNELLLRTKKLFLVDITKVPIHGGSYVFSIKKLPVNYYRIENAIKNEKAAGLHLPDTYINFTKNVSAIKNTLKRIITKYESIGYKLVAYGAAAKGITVLHAFDLKPAYIIDDNKLKQGKYTQISNIPIVSIDTLREEDETTRILFIPLAWNFSNEIRSRIEKVRPISTSHDTFVYYFPEVKES